MPTGSFWTTLPTTPSKSCSIRIYREFLKQPSAPYITSFQEFELPSAVSYPCADLAPLWQPSPFASYTLESLEHTSQFVAVPCIHNSMRAQLRRAWPQYSKIHAQCSHSDYKLMKLTSGGSLYQSGFSACVCAKQRARTQPCNTV